MYVCIYIFPLLNPEILKFIRLEQQITPSPEDAIPEQSNPHPKHTEAPMKPTEKQMCCWEEECLCHSKPKSGYVEENRCFHVFCCKSNPIARQEY